MRKQTSTADKIIFSIVNLVDKADKKENIYFELSDELSDFDNDIFQPEQTIRRTSESDAGIKASNARKQQWQQQGRHTTINDGRVSKKPRFLSE